MNEQSEAWAGEFGNAYTARNRVDWQKRVPFWSDILHRTGARSILEVGCNAGWNLTAIKRAAPWARSVGSDINPRAIMKAWCAGHEAWLDTIGNRADINTDCYELVFTAGVLIHVPPGAIEQTMRDIVRTSNRWVLAIEYGAEREEEITYRGRQAMLWKRPFGEMYEALGLKLSGPAYVLGPDQGFDNCTVYLLEKPVPQQIYHDPTAGIR